MYRDSTTMILNRNELDLLVELVKEYNKNNPRPLPVGKVLVARLAHAQMETGYFQTADVEE